MGAFDLPTREGYVVYWYNGKVIDRKRKIKGEVKVIGQIRCQDEWYTKSKQAAEAKAEELKKQGFEIAGIYECFY